MKTDNERFQELSSSLVPGEVVTVIQTGGFGFVNAFSAKVVEAEYRESWAQYHGAVKFVFRRKRKRKDEGLWLHSGKKFAVLRGEHNPNTEIFGEAKESSVPGISVKEGKYSACDPRWFSDALESVKDAEVIFLNENGY